jgi:hypothetical protein
LYRDGVARAFFLPATRERAGPLMQDFHQHLQQADGAALAQSVRSVLIEREALAPRMAGIKAPALFVAGDSGEGERVNYLVRGRFMVVQRLADRFLLRLGRMQVSAERTQPLDPEASVRTASTLQGPDEASQ